MKPLRFIQAVVAVFDGPTDPSPSRLAIFRGRKSAFGQWLHGEGIEHDCWEVVEHVGLEVI